MEIKIEIGMTCKLLQGKWVASTSYPFDFSCSGYDPKEVERDLHQAVAAHIRELHERGELEKWLTAHEIPFVKAEMITHTIAHHQIMVSLA